MERLFFSLRNSNFNLQKSDLEHWLIEIAEAELGWKPQDMVSGGRLASYYVIGASSLRREAKVCSRGMLLFIITIIISIIQYL